MHSKGICHRDIKPANVLIQYPNQAYLIDFGKAKALRKIDEVEDDSETHFSKTTTGKAGTPLYMAPEVVNA